MTESFGRWLKAEFVKRGLKQNSIARDLAVSGPTVSRWCTDFQKPSDEQVRALSKLLKINAKVISARMS